MCLCDDCGGACCRYVTINVGAMTPDQQRWATMRGDLEGLRWHIRSECEHLWKSGRCAIYSHRPEVCRDFDVGGEYCKDARARWGKERE